MMEAIVKMVMWFLRRERHEISRKGLDRYLTRWTIWGERFAHEPRRNVFLHVFHRGDAEEYFHDHPWPFWSVILWGGYWEHSEEGRVWYGPLSLLRRPASWAHRVELPPNKRCWTMVWCGPKVRSWGFHCPSGKWIHWREHQADQDAGGPGCGGAS